MTSEMQANAEVEPRRSHDMPPWLHRERRREVAELRRTSTVVEILCVGATVAAFLWMGKDAGFYVGQLTPVWFAPVVIALYGARKTGTLERRVVDIEASLTIVEAGSSSGPAGGNGTRVSRRPGRITVARLAWIAFVAATLVLATLGFRSGGDVGDDELEEDGAVVSGQRL